MAQSIPLVIHATHEAGVKVGGIGAVLDGLLGSAAYNRHVRRSLLVGPLFGWDSVQMERLDSPASNLTIRYSSLHGIFDRVAPQLRATFQGVEQTFEIALLYGVRRFGAYEHEVLLVDATNPALAPIQQFHYHVWQHYGVDCDRYGYDAEFNLYFSIAQPLFAALKALEVDIDLAPNQRFIIAHEWLGMPLVFAAQMNEPDRWRTIFYAHEVATARQLIESHSGHDTRFYNALDKALEWGMSLDQIFGDQSDFHKHVVIRQAVRCDNIFAVGDLVVKELRFLGEEFTHKNIDLVYNGVSSRAVTLLERLESKRRLQKYCENLLGYVPDYVFTHVTRMVLSKGMWRDVRVMEHLDRMLADSGETAVLFVLSTSQPAGRRSQWVRAWADQYRWPVGHRADNGDLVGLEADYFFSGVEPYNRSSHNSRIVFVNQFGWSRERCGVRMPADMEFMDIRKGSDLEFGQSIYEPFGIAQVEPINFGAISCISNVCGCVGFLTRAGAALTIDLDSEASRDSSPGVSKGSSQQSMDGPNWVVADYVALPHGYPLYSPGDALAIDQGTRDWIEIQRSGDTARRIFERLPRDRESMRRMMASGEAIAHHLSWDQVVEDYLMPGLLRAQR